MALLGFSIVLLHLLLGFGFLIYKLLPRTKKVTVKKYPEENANKINK